MREIEDRRSIEHSAHSNESASSPSKPGAQLRQSLLCSVRSSPARCAAVLLRLPLAVLSALWCCCMVLHRAWGT